MDADGRNMLQTGIINLLMSCPNKKMQNMFLETVSLMSKRNVHTEWPTLIPELVSNL